MGGCVESLGLETVGKAAKLGTMPMEKAQGRTFVGGNGKTLRICYLYHRAPVLLHTHTSRVPLMNQPLPKLDHRVGPCFPEA